MRTAPWAALVAMFVLLALGISMAIYEEHLYQSQRVREVREEAEILAASMSAALVFHDQKAAQEYVSPLRVNPDLVAVGVYDSEGRLVAGFTREGHRPLPRHLTDGGVRPVPDWLIVTVPVRQGKTTAGTVYVRAIAESPAARMARYAVLALLVIMAVLVLGILAGTQAALARANNALERQAEKLSAANTRLQAEMREREKIETALRQSQKMEAIGQLSGGIAHDFNNLLMIIKGNLGFLRHKKALDPERAARHLAAAMEGADRAEALTRRILAFSRKQPLYPVRIDLNDLVRSLGDLIRNSAGENINVEQDLAATWPVICDENQMESVVLNLVLNARDAMPSGGRLTIRSRDTHLDDESARSQELAGGDYVALSVSDNGSGMPEEVRMRALDPFFTTKPVGEGTGLGLSTAFGFVRQSGGAMRIESDPGRGTTVTVLLPRADEVAAARDEEPKEARL